MAVVALAAVLVLAAACSGGDDDDAERRSVGRRRRATATDDPGDCIVVDMAVSSEKIALLDDLADTFNDRDGAEVDGRLRLRAPAQRRVRPRRHADPAGLAGPRRQRRAAGDLVAGRVGVGRHRQRPRRRELAPAGTPFMLTPLVIAMPQPMAEALGWPQTAARLRRPADAGQRTRTAGASVGHPEWGPFRLGKTNPNFSTSGLNFTIAEYYAAVGKTQGLTIEDLARPAAVEFARQIESSVVHYGDITMTFLNNWFAADARGTSLTYASVVAVEEKSVIDYNRGNPDGVLSPGEEPPRPARPARRDLPGGGHAVTPTARSSCSTPSGSTPTRRPPPRLFEEFVQRPENQQQVLEFGFRPNNADGAAGRPDRRRQRRRPGPADGRARGPVAGRARRHPRLVGRAAQGRPRAARARHLRVDGRARHRRRPTRLDLAQEAAISALDEFKDADDVGLWAFSTDLGGRPTRTSAS